MEKLQALLTAFADLGATSATLGTNYVHVAVRSDDALKLIARQLAVTPESRADGNEHWLSITARHDGTSLYVTGPMRAMPAAALRPEGA
jgi:hypothetical protein